MIIPIVNERDEIIGSKERNDLNYDVDIFRTASLWVTNSSGDILLAQRKMDKKVDPGKWAEAVGGTVDGDDTYEETVIREAEEELGIKNVLITKGPKQFITTPCKYFVQWYVATIDQPIESFIFQKEEVEQIAWIPKNQLSADMKSNPNKYIEALPEIVSLLS